MELTEKAQEGQHHKRHKKKAKEEKESNEREGSRKAGARVGHGRGWNEVHFQSTAPRGRECVGSVAVFSRLSPGPHKSPRWSEACLGVTSTVVIAKVDGREQISQSGIREGEERLLGGDEVRSIHSLGFLVESTVTPIQSIKMRVWALLLAVLTVVCAMAGMTEAMPEPQRPGGLLSRRTFGFRRFTNSRRRASSRPSNSCTNQGLFVVCG
ncbi:hypothetical protein O3P69_005439 [Scylla paramamosain]|uniref:Uncharacterized protein n=1 Tax=Scylla paramamosain TaxID=85552 RepID=A0AAW0UAZ4_SCYPA